MNLMIDDVIYAYDDIFSSFGTITSLAGRNITRQSLLDNDIELLIVRSRTQVNQALLQGTKVCFVGSAVAGLEHIDLDYLSAHNIAFAHAGGSNANAVAEYVITALVNLAHDKQFALADKTLSIIGVGNVGKQLASKAQSLKIKTLLNDPPRQTLENLPKFVPLTKALQADIISFHTPMTTTGNHPSYHLVNANNRHLIKPNAIMINTARGGIIDEAIWQSLPTTNIIDCWENEPHINQTLKQTAYWATPHIAGHSIDAKFMGSYLIYGQLCDYLKMPINQKIAQLVNPLKTTLNTPTLLETLNKIYNFAQDRTCLDNPKEFEDYRRHYPQRYEWKHFKNTSLEKF